MKSQKKKTFLVMLMIAALTISGCSGSSAANNGSSATGENAGAAENTQTVEDTQSTEEAQSQESTQNTEKPQAETGTPGQESSGLEQIAEQAQQTGGDPFAYEEGDGVAQEDAGEGSPAVETDPGKGEAEDLPARFDLREVEVKGSGIVPPVRFQNPFGACWGFAATAAAEISILGSGLAQEDGYTAETFNLSEKHLAYFAATAIEEPDDPQNGEGKQYSSARTGSQKLAGGGDMRYATCLFASGVGPNLEDRDGLDEGDEDVLVYRGRNGETESRKVTWYDENGTPQRGIRRICYSNDDDWDIPYKYRYYQSYRLKDSYILPSPANIIVNMEDFTFSYAYNPQGTEAIKKQLMALRGVSIGVYTEQAHPDQIDRSWKYMSDDWAQYIDHYIAPNHVVCIVGWDDEYPKENFKEGMQPPEDGAWLCRNSWGSDLNEFPDQGYRHWGIVEEENKNSGYFWLSYYDVTIEKPECFVFDKSNVGESYLVDQHDYYPATSIQEFTTGIENKTANVFVTDQSAVLTDISVMTSTPNSEVSYEIYLLRKGYENPMDGVLAASGSGMLFEFGGYHRISLENQVPLFKGQYYSVIVSQTTPSGKSCFCIVCDEGKGGELVIDPEIGFEETEWEPEEWNNLVVNEKESYLYVDGEWHDLADQKIRRVILGMDQETNHNACDNFPIKAYLEEADNPAYPDFADDLVLTADEPGNTKTLLLKLKGAVEEWDRDHEVTWKSSDKSVFLVERNAGDEGVARITAKGKGTAYLTISIDGLGDRVIGVYVE